MQNNDNTSGENNSLNDSIVSRNLDFSPFQEVRDMLATNSDLSVTLEALKKVQTDIINPYANIDFSEIKKSMTRMAESINKSSIQPFSFKSLDGFSEIFKNNTSISDAFRSLETQYNQLSKEPIDTINKNLDNYFTEYDKLTSEPLAQTQQHNSQTDDIKEIKELIINLTKDSENQNSHAVNKNSNIEKQDNNTGKLSQSTLASLMFYTFFIIQGLEDSKSIYELIEWLQHIVSYFLGKI